MLPCFLINVKIKKRIVYQLCRNICYMNTALWVVQCFLALSFGYSGIMKSSQNRERLVRIGQTGVEHLSYPLIRFIGITEVLGAIGIIVPWYTGIAPVLTPVTAVGFAVIMVLAAPIHYRRKEVKAVGINILFFLLSVWVAWMRFAQLQ
jgi:uncharacterized membrane protein YphA (DoxX/SURF4 family)